MVSKLLSITNILNEVKTNFVFTNENEVDILIIETHETSILKVRSYVIYQLLYVLKGTHPRMYGNKIEISLNYDDIEYVIKKLNDE